MRSTTDRYTSVVTIMSYDGTTGQLKCFADGELVLDVNEPDSVKANQISEAIQKTFEAGKLNSSVRMQLAVEHCMNQFRERNL